MLRHKDLKQTYTKPIITSLQKVKFGGIVGLTLPEEKNPKLFRIVSTQSDMMAWLVQVKQVKDRYVQVSLEINTLPWETKCFGVS